MNKTTIKKLRKKFTLAAFISFMIVISIMGGLILLVNHYTSTKQIRAVLNYIVQNGGDISDKNHSIRENIEFISENGFDRVWTEVFSAGLDTSPELRFYTRYFTVWYNEKNEVASVDTANIAAVSDENAINYGQYALDRSDTYGSVDQFSYQKYEENGETMIVFLDCKQHNDISKRLLNIILVLVALGAVIMLVIIFFLSKRMIMPEVRNAEKQKQFITNAGHELKTPLAVIRANTELDIMLNGENEWNQSTLRQTEDLTKLIQDLILIARANEAGQTQSFTETDISKTVTEAVQGLSPIAQKAEKELKTEIEESIKMKADEGRIKQLAVLLIDNAIKYCDDKGTVTVALHKKGKTIRLIVSNDYKDGEKTDCSKFFDRFYRADESHSGEKSGYGIGLSIAESIVENHNGTINASWNSGVIHFTCTFRTK